MLNASATPSQQSKALIYSDKSLKGTRWKLLPGVSVLDMNTQATAAARRVGAGGYHVGIQDGGPNYGVSVTVNSAGKSGTNFVLDLTITNSYIRHTSVFVSFLKADGVTPMTVTDTAWLALLAGSPCWPLVSECLKFFASRKPSWLGGDTLKFLGKVGPESTFLGVPVSSTNVEFKFALPNAVVGKVRLLVGSLGVSSGNDWDPTAAWFGLALTAFIDLAVPTFSLLLAAGVETNAVFDKMFKDLNLLLPIVGSVFTTVEDLFTDPQKVGKDIGALVLTLSNALIKNVLTKPEVLAELGVYFGLEEAEEAIPFVGWAFKAIAMAATVLQLGQTVGEVAGSPRVVEFDLTVTMDAQITLVPDSEFPQTAKTYTITAQYTGNTTRTYSGTVADPKASSIVVDWNDVPVGGTVSFVVAMFDANGWGVGKGKAGPCQNFLNGNPVFKAQVTVEQELYPLTKNTTYQHSQLLQYGQNGYHWVPTQSAPTATRANLGSGPDGGLEELGNITLTDDLGVLGYVWEGSGPGMPPPIGNGGGGSEIYTMSNIAYRPPKNSGTLLARRRIHDRAGGVFRTADPALRAHRSWRGLGRTALSLSRSERRPANRLSPARGQAGDRSECAHERSITEVQPRHGDELGPVRDAPHSDGDSLQRLRSRGESGRRHHVDPRAAGDGVIRRGCAVGDGSARTGHCARAIACSGAHGHSPRPDDPGAGGGQSTRSGVQPRRPPGAGIRRAVLLPARIPRVRRRERRLSLDDGGRGQLHVCVEPERQRL